MNDIRLSMLAIKISVALPGVPGCLSGLWVRIVLGPGCGICFSSVPQPAPPRDKLA